MPVPVLALTGARLFQGTGKQELWGRRQVTPSSPRVPAWLGRRGPSPGPTGSHSSPLAARPRSCGRLCDLDGRRWAGPELGASSPITLKTEPPGARAEGPCQRSRCLTQQPGHSRQTTAGHQPSAPPFPSSVHLTTYLPYRSHQVSK